MKKIIINLLRKLHLLPIVEKIFLIINVFKNYKSNLKYSREHNIKIPPYSLMFDAYNHCNLSLYHNSGKIHADIIKDIISQYKSIEEITLCEWGCGAARILQQFDNAELIGTDYNGKTIAWCKKNFPNIRFIKNELCPPLPLESNSIDVLYCISVFTHLSEEQQILWINEIKRVLKPNGLFIASFHGNRTLNALLPFELKSINEGKVVVRGNVKEGSKFFLSYHNDDFIKGTLLNGFTSIKKIEPSSMHQDVWCAILPD